MEKHCISELSHRLGHTESEMKVLLGQLAAETISKVLGYPQGLPEIENTGENITGSFGHGCGRLDHPHFTDRLLEKQFLEGKWQGTP